MAITNYSIYGVLMLVLAAADASFDWTTQCDNVPMRVYYKNLGCVPVGDEPCPTSYNCDAVMEEFRPVNGSCIYNGKTIQPGQTVETGQPCKFKCSCSVNNPDNVGVFSCPVYDCPWGDLEEGCHYRYVENKCCPEGQLCPARDKSLSSCEFGGHTYHEGVEFNPEGYRCVSCKCQKGFNGTVAEPWCSLYKNNYLDQRQSIIEGCTPVFLPSVCFSLEWRCPKPADKVTRSSSNSPSESQSKCTFGSHELNVGDKLEDEDINCTCITPPFVTCSK